MNAAIRNHQVAAAILAAGASRRMGTCKALLKLEGVTFLERIARLYSQAAIPTVAVVGEEIEPFARRLDLGGAAVVVNPHPEDGPISSLLLALGRLAEASALILHPVDHPLVLPSTVSALQSRHRRTPSCILIPSHRGAKGHPVLFPRRFFPDLRACPPDQGARWAVRRNRASTLWVEVEDGGILANLNRPEDLAGLRVGLKWRPFTWTDRRRSPGTGRVRADRRTRRFPLGDRR